jgi:hypothetical protein
MDVWSGVRDEGGPLAAGGQEPGANHRELLSSRAMVVSVAKKGGTTIPSGEVQGDERKRTAGELSKPYRRCQNRGVV